MNWALSCRDAELAIWEGGRRRLRRIYGTAPADRFQPADRWRVDIEGCAAEIAFARAMNLPWFPSEGPQALRDGDVGGWEVKHRPHENAELNVYDHTPDEVRCVLVTGAMPDFIIHGWLTARAAKQARYRRNDIPFPAFFVPQADLHSFSATEAVAA